MYHSDRESSTHFSSRKHMQTRKTLTNHENTCVTTPTESNAQQGALMTVESGKGFISLFWDSDVIRHMLTGLMLT